MDVSSQNPTAHVQTPSTTQKGNKRSRDEVSPVENENVEAHVAENVTWPRFLVIEPTDAGRPLSGLSPFIIEKAMRGLAGTVRSAKKLRSGVILVETLRQGQSENLLKQTQFASVPVKVSAHRSLNSSRGVIRNFDLAQMTAEELVEELAPQGVIGARHITQRRGLTNRRTPVVVLTFGTPLPPVELKTGYLVLKVDRFIPNPLRCYTCHAFGHH